MAYYKHIIAILLLGTAHITDMRFPVKYDDIDIKLENIGDWWNTVINGAVIYLIQVQEIATGITVLTKGIKIHSWPTGLSKIKPLIE